METELTLYEFAKKYIRIQTNDGVSELSDLTLEKIREISNAEAIGGRIRVVRIRRGNLEMIVYGVN